MSEYKYKEMFLMQNLFIPPPHLNQYFETHKLNFTPLNMQLIDNTINALYNATFNSCVMQDKYKTEHLNNLQYFKEFCTIKYSSARQTGHTTAILYLIRRYFYNALFLSPTHEMSQKLCTTLVNWNNIFSQKPIYNHTIDSVKIKNDFTDENDIYIFKSYKNLNINSLRGTMFEAIVVDGTFGLNDKIIKMIYEQLSVNMTHNHFKFFYFIE